MKLSRTASLQKPASGALAVPADGRDISGPVPAAAGSAARAGPLHFLDASSAQGRLNSLRASESDPVLAFANLSFPADPFLDSSPGQNARHRRQVAEAAQR